MPKNITIEKIIKKINKSLSEELKWDEVEELLEEIKVDLKTLKKNVEEEHEKLERQIEIVDANKIVEEIKETRGPLWRTINQGIGVEISEHGLGVNSKFGPELGVNAKYGIGNDKFSGLGSGIVELVGVKEVEVAKVETKDEIIKRLEQELKEKKERIKELEFEKVANQLTAQIVQVTLKK